MVPQASIRPAILWWRVMGSDQVVGSNTVFSTKLIMFYRPPICETT